MAAKLTAFTSFADAQARATGNALWALFDGTRERFNIAHECLVRHADGSGRAAVRIVHAEGRDEVLTFDAITAGAAQFAHWLKVKGVQPGERIAFMLEPSLPFYICLFGAMLSGAISVPLFTLFGPDALRLRITSALVAGRPWQVLVQLVRKRSSLYPFRQRGRAVQDMSSLEPEARPQESDWKATILAGLANYIDAGSIVAGSAALALWVEIYKLSPTFVGLIGAFSANAISAGLGALAGGILCDRFGRKKIYQFDMLFYAFGMTWLVFATAPWMIVLGFVLVGVAVGADIPASWSLIAEQAPDGKRGQHSGVAQVLWYMGPVVVLLMFLVLSPLGVLGARIVFAHLAVIAVLLTFFRARMSESKVWLDAQSRADAETAAGASKRANWRELLQPRHLRSLAFLIGMYGMWNLWAGTNGFFFPYILRTIGDQSQAVSVAVQAYMFALGMASILLIFMPLSDKVNQRLLFGVSAVMQVAGMSLLAIFTLTLPLALIHVTMMAIGGGFGAQSFFQLWSAELFPTMVRSTAQGIAFAAVRISLGLWSFFVPVLTATGFHTLAWILVGFLAASGLIGTIWAPRNEGKSLEGIQEDLTRAARA